MTASSAELPSRPVTKMTIPISADGKFVYADEAFVPWSLKAPETQALLAKTTGVPGVYRIEYDGVTLKIGESKMIVNRLRDHIGAATSHGAKQGAPAFWRAFAGKLLRVQWVEVRGGRDEALAKYRRESVEARATDLEARLPLWNEYQRGPHIYVADRDPLTGPAFTLRVKRTVAGRWGAARRKLVRRD
jgi:hypothetical protein